MTNLTDRIVALGLSGGPKLTPDGAKPALALVAGGQTYLVDCGFETAKQLVASGLGFADLKNIFITHNHLDHTSGILGVLVHGWTNLGSELPKQVDLYGPTPSGRLKELAQVAHAHDIQNYITGGGFRDFPTLETHDVLNTGAPVIDVMEDENVRVTATKVFHGRELKDSFAYRFDIKATGKSVVFSGDVAAHDANLIALAHGCDFLVHEVQDNEMVERVVGRLPDQRQAELRDHLLTSHTNVEDLPAIGKAAGAKHLVMSHYTPIPQSPLIYLEKATKFAESIGYTGKIIAPTELDQIEI